MIFLLKMNFTLSKKSIFLVNNNLILFDFILIKVINAILCNKSRENSFILLVSTLFLLFN